MKNSQVWFSIKELMDEKLEALPTSDKGIVKKAARENWQKRQREGVKGKTFEYYVGDMPESVQKALGFKPKIGGPLPFIFGGAGLAAAGVGLPKPKIFEDKPSHLNDIDLQERIAQLENKLLALENKTQGFVSSKPSEGLSNDEWQLVRAFRRCNDDRRVGLLATAEALAVQTEKEQKESSEPLTDSKIA